MTYAQIRNNFLKKLWNAKMVKLAVSKGVISTEQYNTIMYEGVGQGVIAAKEYAEQTGLVYKA